jgi:hypothetical protein
MTPWIANINQQFCRTISDSPETQWGKNNKNAKDAEKCSTAPYAYLAESSGPTTIKTDREQGPQRFWGREAGFMFLAMPQWIAERPRPGIVVA